MSENENALRAARGLVKDAERTLDMALKELKLRQVNKVSCVMMIGAIGVAQNGATFCIQLIDAMLKDLKPDAPSSKPDPLKNN